LSGSQAQGIALTVLKWCKNESENDFIAFISYKLQIKTTLFRMNSFIFQQSVTVTSLFTLPYSYSDFHNGLL
jgi:hypothetical protein